ncbi:MAG: hypothetical protein V4526_02465 [Patescibacteria group bacterium]
MDVTEPFLSAAQKHKSFLEAVSVAENNSEGSVWLIGGYIYRTLATTLYGAKPLREQDVDFDFLVERLPKKIKVDKSWTVSTNRYGNPKLIRGDLKIDLIPIEHVRHIVRQGLKPTIKNFLSGTPLGIQSIVFNLRTRDVLGHIGISAIRRKIVEVNDRLSAEYYCGAKMMPLDAIIKKKAEELGFTANLSH